MKSNPLFKNILIQTKKVYRKRLVTLAVFGSWAAGKHTAESDIDILIVAEELPRRRLARVEEFQTVEIALEDEIKKLRRKGIYTYLSPIFKTPEEVKQGSLLFLDMIYDLNILFDREDFFADYLKDFKKKLDNMGAKRIIQGEKWYWVLKPDYKWGDTFEI
jgi:predicted nucleotidyltransferase